MAVFDVRRQLAAFLGMPLNAVRVIQEYTGGGFGSKNICLKHTIMAALFARRFGGLCG